jgi:hypothetical protein
MKQMLRIAKACLGWRAGRGRARTKHRIRRPGALALSVLLGWGVAVSQAQAQVVNSTATTGLGSDFKSETASVNGTTLRYVRGGKGKALILIHGFPQRFGFSHRPDRGLDGVPAQLPERGDAFVTVDYQITFVVVFGDHDDDRRLLAALSQRRQQMALVVRLANSQMLPSLGRVGETPVAWSSRCVRVCGRLELVFCGTRGSALGTVLESVRYGRNWSFAVRTISAPITPMKSAPCGPNWSFATSQGSCFNGAGIRSGLGSSVCAARWSIRQAMQ